MAKKRNLALQEAKGELITWFDDDNWQHPDKLTWLSEALCAGASYDIRVLRKLIGEDSWGDTSEQLHALRERIGGESSQRASQLTFSGSSEQHSVELKGGAREAVMHLAEGWRSISAYGQDGLLSVLMSAYRTGPWVRAAVKSVLSQELPTGWELELIIAVDGCDEVLREVLKIEDARLVVLELAENGGTYRALNTALRYARGALIAILDSDDIAMPGRFRKQIEALQRHPEIALLGGQLMAINEKGELLPNKLCLSLDALSEFRRGWGLEELSGGSWHLDGETRDLCLPRRLF